MLGSGERYPVFQNLSHWNPLHGPNDHGCLIYLDWMKNERGRLSSWSLLLQDFDFTVKDRPDNSNSNAIQLVPLTPGLRFHCEIPTRYSNSNADDLFRPAWDSTSLLRGKGGVSVSMITL